MALRRRRYVRCGVVSTIPTTRGLPRQCKQTYRPSPRHETALSSLPNGHPATRTQTACIYFANDGGAVAVAVIVRQSAAVVVAVVCPDKLPPHLMRAVTADSCPPKAAAVAALCRPRHKHETAHRPVCDDGSKRAPRSSFRRNFSYTPTTELVGLACLLHFAVLCTTLSVLSRSLSHTLSPVVVGSNSLSERHISCGVEYSQSSLLHSQIAGESLLVFCPYSKSPP